MDPALDPLPLSAQPSGPIPAAAPVAAAANPTPALLVAHNHPPYAEMITAAITALKERDGSSKKAISKYIETHYSDLPPTHPALLTHHLKRLKASGQLIMVKYSYKLPTARSTAAAVNGAADAVPSDPSSSVTKRRPGRPPKPNPDAVQAAVPVFGASINMNAEPAMVPAAFPPPGNVAVGPVNGPGASGLVRGRGRPPKRGRGRPPKSGVAPPFGVGPARGRGRPRKNAAEGPAAAGGMGPGRPRGRPPKPINVAPGGGGIQAAPVLFGAPPGGVAPVAGKRRGRPPKAGFAAKKQALQPRKPRNLSGKPLGRPRKNAFGGASRNSDSELIESFLGLKERAKNLASKVKDTANLIRPLLDSEDAINALQELEVAAEDAVAPPVSHLQQPVRVADFQTGSTI